MSVYVCINKSKWMKTDVKNFQMSNDEYMGCLGGRKGMGKWCTYNFTRENSILKTKSISNHKKLNVV